MRVAIVTPGFSAHPRDWAIPALQNLASSLAQRHEVYVFSQRYPAKGLYQFDNVTHLAIGGGQKRWLGAAQLWIQTRLAIIAQHRKRPFDLIHAFWAGEPGFSALLAGAALKRPVVVSFIGGELVKMPHIDYGESRFLVRRLQLHHVLQGATALTAASTYQRNLCLEHGVSESKLFLAPWGFNTTLFRPHHTHALSPQSPILIQAASLIAVKNQEKLLQVFRQVKDTLPNAHLQVAGSGPLKASLLALADQLGLSQAITWSDQVSYLDMPSYYQQGHLYIQTSWHEGQGLAVLEAMACGLPVLGTPVGVVQDFAWAPATWSNDMLAQQIIDLCQNETRYTQVSQKARQTVSTEFSLPATTRRFEQLYTQSLSLTNRL